MLSAKPLGSYVGKELEKVVASPKPKMTWDEYFSKYEAEPDFSLERPNNDLPQKRGLF